MEQEIKEGEAFWNDFTPYGKTKCKCHKCGWEGIVDDLEHYTFEDDRVSKYYCPECEEEISLP